MYCWVRDGPDVRGPGGGPSDRSTPSSRRSRGQTRHNAHYVVLKRLLETDAATLAGDRAHRPTCTPRIRRYGIPRTARPSGTFWGARSVRLMGLGAARRAVARYHSSRFDGRCTLRPDETLGHEPSPAADRLYGGVRIATGQPTSGSLLWMSLVRIRPSSSISACVSGSTK